MCVLENAVSVMFMMSLPLLLWSIYAVEHVFFYFGVCIVLLLFIDVIGPFHFFPFALVLAICAIPFDLLLSWAFTR